MSTVPNIVLDTNCLIMAISARNDYHLVWQAFLHGEYVLCVSNEIIEEYLEVLARNINPWVAESVFPVRQQNLPLLASQPMPLVFV